MFCNHCGAQQQFEGSKFCNACGGELPLIGQPVPMPVTEVTAIPGLEKPLGKKGFTPKQIVGGLGLILAGFAILSTFVDSSRTDENSLSVKAVPSLAPSPTATAIPNLSPSQHLAEAKKLIRGAYDKENYEAAIKHLSSIPAKSKESKEADALTEKVAKTFLNEEMAGDMPETWSYDGRVMCVDSYLRRALNDYDSAEYLEWGSPEKVKIKGVTYWQVGLRLRAKNAFGAMIVKTMTFLIQRNQVVKAD